MGRTDNRSRDFFDANPSLPMTEIQERIRKHSKRADPDRLIYVLCGRGTGHTLEWLSGILNISRAMVQKLEARAVAAASKPLPDGNNIVDLSEPVSVKMFEGVLR